MSFELLTQPISPEKPCGGDLRGEPLNAVYYQIKDIRFDARTIEKNNLGDNGQAQTRDHWKRVYELSLNVLETQSKNLQIVSWMIEALVRLEGFKGLAKGFLLTRQLIELYWDQLYPLPEKDQDENDLDNRIASLAGLSGEENEGTLIFPILNTEITQGKSVPSYTTWQYQKALEVDRISDPIKKKEKTDAGGIILEDFVTSAKETDPVFFKELDADLRSALQELKSLDAILFEKCKEQSPSFSRINQSLTLCLDSLTSFAKDYIIPSSNELLGATQENPFPEGSYTMPSFTSREESFQNLLRIADFFSQSEPHSPLPYLIKKAVRWGRMPLPDLLSEIVEDENNLKTIFRLAGMEVKQ